MLTTREQELGKILADDELTLIYDILAREDFDEVSRDKFLGKYRLTQEGLQVLVSALRYANQIKQEAISKVKQDPYDHSGYNDYEAKTKTPNRVIADLEANIQMGVVQDCPINTSSQIYDKLAVKDFDITLRYKFLKKYRMTDEGLQLLVSTVEYACQKEKEAISKVKQDPYDRSGYDDYQEKTKIPKRVIEDLKANIRMGRLVKTHPFWNKASPAQHDDVEYVSKYVP